MSRITDIASEIAAAEAARLGLEIWDVEFVAEAGRQVLRLFADKDGGIGIDDCEALSRAVEPLLDEAVEQTYVLEVSSPGMERALKKQQHFARYIGENVEVRLYAPQDGGKTHVGILKSHTPESVTIETENGEVTFASDIIGRVKLKPDYSKYF